MHTWQDDDDDEDADAESTAAAKDSTEEIAAKVATWKVEEATLIEMIGSVERSNGKQVVGYLKRLEDDLSMIRDSIWLAQPVPQRVKALRRAHTNRTEWVNAATEEAVAKYEVIREATDAYKAANDKLGQDRQTS